MSEAASAKAWNFLGSYPPGVRFDMPLPAGPVQDILSRTARDHPDRVALEFNGAAISYGELQALVLKAATGFRALGVGPGVHVGLYLPNCPHYVIAFFGVLTAGGTVVNYSPLDAARVLEHKVEDSETDILVTLDLKLLYPQMAALLGRTRLKRLVVGNLGDFSPEPETVAAFLKAAGQTADVPDDDRHLPFRRLLDNAGNLVPHAVPDPAATIAVLQYTGGTTGLPKGAMLSHGNLTAAQAQLLELCSGDAPLFEIGAERILAVLPLFHIYALSVNMLLGIAIAARLVLQPKFEAEAALQTLTAARITFFPGVPTMYAGLLNHPAMARADLTSLKFCGTGGAPLPVELADRFQRLTGCRLTEGWGMTETTATGTFTPARGPVKPGSCGVPVPHARLKFVDVADPGREVGFGERGELCIAGPNVMKGYWKKPAANAEAFTADGYFRTGDVAWMDGDGYVHIVDRTKDMILCGGFNVYPRVIEEVIYEHPAIAEVTVIGIHDDYRGQAPKAFVTLKPGAETVTLAAMQDFLKSRLGKHEMIAALEVRAELPKTPVGKLSKKELVEEEEARRHP
ncbi:long-chain-fatty-acid--CoA ligase [Zavarzinia compransoris]|uniref:Long-chain-fatty-acid--CoA ligase n=1 Tax=Zavarzinia compransoris TaxID=1264899 RepID=A0A317E733_9PROT|nr:long-chain fatty acid--CoA ligase [Zavarzinia compransoris]PWR22046.1 dicarboxylate--CoA ligase PimA [Zavarzinia compransoris]TDP47213.1 long-chain acyl-CoA synthetase [Zavarzinia compransoris]